MHVAQLLMRDVAVAAALRLPQVVAGLHARERGTAGA
jgi:hypothetical protein